MPRCGALFFSGCFHRRAQICDEMLVLAFARFLIGLAKKRRWMNSRQHPRCELRGQHLAMLPSDAESGSEDGLRRCCTHCHDQIRPNDPQFRFQPGTTGCDFTRIRLLMNPAFAARLPLKMFYRIRDIDLRPIDSGFLEGAVHDFARWPNEWFAGHIFVIARLLANQHHRCALGTFAKDSLRPSFIQMTCGAMSCCFAHRA